MKRLISLLPIALFTALSFGQENMDAGFRLLESGEFAAAESFFESYLKSNPTNKTAQLCYGRAVGLNGRPELATRKFQNLLKQYPGDLEITLNYNESLLWDKKYDQAKPLYAKLVQTAPESFGALLGYANTLSNLKEYNEALTWVDKALAQDPGNPNAELSKKYILLGYANTLATSDQFEAAEGYLQNIFTIYPEDREALLSLANLYLQQKDFNAARDAFEKMASTPQDSITALNGIALAAHLEEKDKEALETATYSLNNARALNDSELLERAQNRYIQALIWNRKYVRAGKLIDSLAVANPQRDWILALRATLGLYTGSPKESVRDYDKLLVLDSTSFDGNLGKANALFAAGRPEEALEAARKTLIFYPNQKDALQLIEKINRNYIPQLSQQGGYSFDNGNNVAVFSNTTVSLATSTKLKTSLTYGYRTTENTLSGEVAESHNLIAGAAYTPFPKATLSAQVGANAADFMGENYVQPLFNAAFQWEPLKLQNVRLGYQREMENFNAALIAREIVKNHYQLTYNLGTNFGLGWYTQLMHTEQSDANSRDLLFTSIYYSVLRKPALKVGVNYQLMGFTEQVPELYFSPSRYQAIELFADFRGQFSPETGYVLSSAFGQQQVEDDPNSGLFRIEAGLTHQFSKRFGANLYGKYSNVASATAAGFEATEIGVRVNWLMGNQPIFKTSGSK